MDIDQERQGGAGSCLGSGSEHNLRFEGQAWDLQEAATDPRMEGVAGTECEFSLTLEFGI